MTQHLIVNRVIEIIPSSLLSPLLSGVHCESQVSQARLTTVCHFQREASKSDLISLYMSSRDFGVVREAFSYVNCLPIRTIARN